MVKKSFSYGKKRPPVLLGCGIAKREYMFVFGWNGGEHRVVWYYAESQSLSYFIPKAQQLPLRMK